MNFTVKYPKSHPLIVWAVLLTTSMAAVAAGTRSLSHPASAGPRHQARNKRLAQNKAMAQYAQMPLTFEANRGQVDRHVDYITRGPGYTMYLSPRGAVMAFAEAPRGAVARKRAPRGVMVGMKLLKSNPRARAVAAAPLAGRTHYLIGSDPSQWKRRLPTTAKVRYEGVYPGVDLVYYGNHQQLEYDFVVKPGADPNAVRLGFIGARGIQVDRKGDLLLRTSMGALRQHKPVVYQNIGGKRRPVAAEYALRGKNQAGFRIAKYDTRQPLIIDPVISFSTFVGGTMDDYGTGIAVDGAGNSYVCGYTESFDEARDNAPASIDAAPRYPAKPAKFAFPTTAGAYLTSIQLFFYRDDLDVANGPEFTFFLTTYHAFTFKLNPAGSGLVYSTYLGSAGQDDYAMAIAVDTKGSAYVTGMTDGTAFPRQNPLQANNGGSTDAFVVKLTPDGSAPVYSTYLGGSSTEVGRSVAVDGSGNCIVTGLTSSNNLPVANAFQPLPLSAGQHQFIANINSNGTAFNYCTYLSGTNGQEGGDLLIESINPYQGASITTTIDPRGTPKTHVGMTYFALATQFMFDYGAGVAVDALGNAYVTGGTTSTTFPTTSSVVRNTKTTPDQDIFVAKFSPFGLRLWATYAGGSGNDAGRAVAVDDGGNAYVTGYTASTDLLTGITGGFKTAYAGGAHDAYVLKLSSDGSRIVYGSYVGGTGDDIANGIAVNDTDSAYIVGNTTSPDLPILNPVQGGLGGNFGQDAFVVKFAPSGSAVEYLTYLGGTTTDWGMAIALDPDGAALVTGSTVSGSFPVTRNVFQGGLRSTDDNTVGFYDFATLFPLPFVDAFVTRITNPPVAPANLRVTFVSTTQIDLAWDDKSVTETSFEIERSPDGNNFTTVGAVGANIQVFQDKGLISNTLYYYRVRAVNSQGPSAYSNVVNITTLPSVPAAPTKITATTLDQTRITVQITDGADNESTITLERSTDGTNFSLIKPFGPQPGTGGVITYVDGEPPTAPLMPNTKYYYRARASNTAGDSAYVGPVNATTLTPAPAVAPSNGTATPVSDTQLDLAWTYAVNPTDALGFKIYRGPDATNLTLYRVTSTPATTLSDTGLTPLTTYFYRVGAYNNSGDGPLSAVFSGKTLAPPPAAPTNLSATVISATRIDLTFTDNSTSETDFQIERSTDGGANYTAIAFPAFPPASGQGIRTYSDTTVVADTTYTYRVKADITTGSNHSLSGAAGPVTVSTPPTAPTLVSVVGLNSSTVLVTFTDNSKSETAFTVQRSINGGAFQNVSTTVSAVPGSPNTVQFQDTGAQAEAANTYRVLATTGASSSGPSGTLSVVPLAAPTNAQGSATGQTTVTFSFKDNSNSEAGFKAERSTDSTNWTPVPGSIGASPGTGGIVTFSDSGLAAQTTYVYRVWAFGTNAESDRVATSVTTLPDPPALPTNLAVAPGTQTTLNVTFTDNSDTEVGFIVERSTSANGTYTAITGSPFAPSTGTGNVVSITDTGLTANTTYFYRVKAFNGTGDLGFVGPASGTTLPNAPAAPTGVSASLTGPTTITLTFTDNANDESGFVVQRSTDGGNTFPVTLASVPAKVPSGTVTVVDAGLAGDTTYTYRVKATNGGGESAFVKSNGVLTAAAAPSNLTFTSITNNQIRLFWVNNSSTATSFKVERSTDGTNFAPLTTVSAPTVSYLDTGLSGNTTYTYRVRAANGAPFDSPFSSPASATTLPNPAGAPTNLQLTPKSQTQIDVTFIDASTNEDGFKVERSTNGVNWVPVSNNLAASPGTGQTITVHDTGLTPDTAYSYRVQSFNAGGASDFASAGPVKTFPPPPGSPSNLTVSVVPGSSTQLLLQWRDGSNNETGFLVERAVGNSNAFSPVPGSIGASNGSGGTVTFTDSGLTPNTRYTYRVSATNQGGASQPTATAGGLTLPGTPTGVSATANAANTGLVVRWNAPQGGADSYVVQAKTDQPNDPGYHQVGTGAANDRSFTLSQLIPNVTFTFRVLAVNGSGNSAPSGEASAKINGGLVSLTVGPTSVKGKKSATGTVTILGTAPAGGATVSLSSSSGSVTVPGSVVVPAGSSSATFTITTVKVKKATTATISATYGGTTKTATLKVKK